MSVSRLGPMHGKPRVININWICWITEGRVNKRRLGHRDLNWRVFLPSGSYEDFPAWSDAMAHLIKNDTRKPTRKAA